MARNAGIMSIDGFKAQIGDILRPNLFYLYITDGTAKDQAKLGQMTDLAFYAHSASIPASSIQAVDVAFMGRSLRVAGNRTFADWNITIYSDIGYKLREAFEIWSGAINTHATNLGHNRIRSYLRNANVYQLDQEGYQVAHYEMRDIWPSNVGDIQLAWSNNNQVESFQVTLTVGTYWVRDVNKNPDTPLGWDGASTQDSRAAQTNGSETIGNDGGAAGTAV